MMMLQKKNDDNDEKIVCVCVWVKETEKWMNVNENKKNKKKWDTEKNDAEFGVFRENSTIQIVCIQITKEKKSWWSSLCVMSVYVMNLNFFFVYSVRIKQNKNR